MLPVGAPRVGAVAAPRSAAAAPARVPAPVHVLEVVGDMVMSAAKMDKWGTRFLIVGILGSLVLIIGFFIYVMATYPGTEVLSYDFEVVREEALVTVRDGGSIDIDYTFEFINYGDVREDQWTDMQTAPPTWHIRIYQQFGLLFDRMENVAIIRTDLP